MTVPNAITFVRLGLVPLFVWLYLSGQVDWAVVCFAVAMGSDALDGLLARLLHQRSALGAFLDPLADKLLLGAAIVLLLKDHLAPVWLLALVGLRDGMMAAAAAWVRRKGLTLPQLPSRIGKYATFSLTTFVVLGLWERTRYGIGEWTAYRWVFGYTAGLCVVISTVQYFARFGHLLFAPSKAPQHREA